MRFGALLRSLLLRLDFCRPVALFATLGALLPLAGLSQAQTAEARAPSTPTSAPSPKASNAKPAQGLEPNPEYDRIIAEALKEGKDPVDYALELGKSEDWASKFDAYKIKKAAIEDEKRIAGKKEAAIEDEKRIAGKKEAAMARKEGEKKIDEELINKTKLVISAMKTLEKNGKFGPNDVAEVNKMYHSPHLPKEAKGYDQEGFLTISAEYGLCAQEIRRTRSPAAGRSAPVSPTSSVDRRPQRRSNAPVQGFSAAS